MSNQRLSTARKAAPRGRTGKRRTQRIDPAVAERDGRERILAAVTPEIRPELALFLVLGAGSHLFDVSALAERSQGIDTSAAWTCEAFVLPMRILLEQGLFRRT